MSALVGYDSSDEEDLQFRPDAMIEAADGSNTIPSSTSKISGLALGSEENHTNGASKPGSEANSSLVGPLFGSDVSHVTVPGPTSFQYPLPGSPFTQHRAALRDLTLPQLPRLDIPPSPPGSPPPGLEIKLGQFENLRKQGVHFNSKLAASSALKNPSLLPRLLAAAGLNEDFQYANTLADEAFIPTEYPDHAYTESLDVSQEQLATHSVKDRAGRERQFVPAAQ